MLNIARSRKASYRQRFGNIGKLLVMEPPTPDVTPIPTPLTVTTTSNATAKTVPTASHLVTVGVQYDASAPSLLDSSLEQTPSAFYLPHPLQPRPVDVPQKAKKMMDATEFDMADGRSPRTLSHSSSVDSLEAGSCANTTANGGSNCHRSGATELDERISVDLADISLSAANGAALHAASEASDSGFSRSCASESISTAVGDGDESHPAVFSDVTSNSTTPDEGIEEPEPKMNGIESVQDEEEPEEEDVTPQPPSHAEDDMVRERQHSEGSLNESITSSSHSSSTGNSDRRQSASGRPTPAVAAPQSPRDGSALPRRSPQAPGGAKGKFSHVGSRIDSSWRRPPAKKRVHFEGVPAAPHPSADSAADAEGEAEGEEEEEAEEEEEVFVIHHGPGFEEPANRNHSEGSSGSGGNNSRIVSFQEPRSLVKQYIKGRQGTGGRMKPRIIKQTTIETAELARKPQRAIPVPTASAPGGMPNIPVKQTNASKKRLEKLRQESAAQLERLQAESSYMTPLQRKEMEVKELRRQLGEAYYIIEQREIELDVFHHEKDREVRFVVEEKNDLIKELEESLEMAHDELDTAKEEVARQQEKEKELCQEIAGLKAEAEKKEARHQQLYLEMYRKGRDSAMFEREDELENLALEESNNVTKEELLRKLSHTQLELEHWQMVKLAEHYDEAARPETEAEAMLNFLKDSMFHYITETKREAVEQHLRAIIRIFKFTEVQMKTINRCMEERKKKGKI